MSNDNYIVFVQYGDDVPMVASSAPRVDSDFNLYVDLSDKLSEAFITSNDNYFKAVEKSFEGMQGYTISKLYL